MKKNKSKLIFDCIIILIFMLLAIAIFILCISPQIKTYYNFQQEPLREATIRVKELTNSEYVSGEVSCWNKSGEVFKMNFGDISLNYFLDK